MYLYSCYYRSLAPYLALHYVQAATLTSFRSRPLQRSRRPTTLWETVTRKAEKKCVYFSSSSPAATAALVGLAIGLAFVGYAAAWASIFCYNRIKEKQEEGKETHFMGKAHWKKSIFMLLLKSICNPPITPQHAGKHQSDTENSLDIGSDDSCSTKAAPPNNAKPTSAFVALCLGPGSSAKRAHALEWKVLGMYSLDQDEDEDNGQGKSALWVWV